MGNEARRNDGAFMKVLETGHIYQPQNRQEYAACQGQTIRFINGIQTPTSGQVGDTAVQV
jgi:hypothetical protein